ncbi:hypothetical protein DY000_02041196 [Brassica cretica]|uniref:DUF4005 domain-containing protein n=1 Tax=Brassica cretica TaxID=69181 RepID=A0ABQ7BNW4_BRACR|nr:hypothetical protein DY000_02041196 [Brassica cretica]
MKIAYEPPIFYTPKTARGPKTDEDLKSKKERKNVDTDSRNQTLHHQGRGSSADHKKPPKALTIAHFQRTRDSREEGRRSRGASHHRTEHAIDDVSAFAPETKTAVQIENGEPIDLLYAPLPRRSLRNSLQSPKIRLHHTQTLQPRVATPPPSCTTPTPELLTCEDSTRETLGAEQRTRRRERRPYR